MPVQGFWTERWCWLVKLKSSQQLCRHLIRMSCKNQLIHNIILKPVEGLNGCSCYTSCQIGFQVATICYGPLFCRLEQEICGVLHPDRVKQNHLCDLISPLENYVKQSLNLVRHLLWVRSVSKMKLQSSVTSVTQLKGNQIGFPQYYLNHLRVNAFRPLYQKVATI